MCGGRPQVPPTANGPPFPPTPHPLVSARYVQQVRAEYAHVEDSHWCAGRPAVMQRFLDVEHLYFGEPTRRAWEEKARANVSAELAALRGVVV